MEHLDQEELVKPNNVVDWRKSKVTLGLGIALAIACLLVVVMTGLFATKEELNPKINPKDMERVAKACGMAESEVRSGDPQIVNHYIDSCQNGVCDALSCEMSYPKSYVAYHLRDQRINIDGRLDDQAWAAVPWTEDFIDIKGPEYTSPRYQTKVKMRYDDTFLYIGAYMQEQHIWANLTERDDIVMYDNDFELFIGPDGTNHWYNDFKINAAGAVWDLELNKPYLNGGRGNNSFNIRNLQARVYLDGTLNDPSDIDNFWSAEIALPFNELVKPTTIATRVPPQDKDQWRINFHRVEWKLEIENGRYVKVPGFSKSGQESNWIWSSQGVRNCHLPERWGFVEFRNTNEVGRLKYSKWEKWHQFSAVMETYYAMKALMANTGTYTAELPKLNLPPGIANLRCNKLNIDVMGRKFNVTAISVDSGDMCVINQDRYVTFPSKFGRK